MSTSNARYIELVWRLSEFAFFVRLLRWAHFLFYSGENIVCDDDDTMCLQFVHKVATWMYKLCFRIKSKEKAHTREA